MSEICNDKFLTTDASGLPPRDNISIPDDVDEPLNVEKENEENKTSCSQNSNTIPDRAQKPTKPKPRAYSNNKATHKSTKVINVSNSSGVHIGNVHNYSLFTNGSKDKENDSFKNKHSQTAGAEVRTPEVKQILSSEKLMKRGHIDIVATHLGGGWRDVGMKLGYSNGQLDHFYADFKHIGTKEVVYQLLLDWTRTNPQECHIGKLTTILWESDQYDVVHRLVQNV